MRVSSYALAKGPHPMIKKQGSKFVVASSTGKKLSKPKTKKKAVKQLRAIEYYKRHPKK
jgi:hypothetical protein